MLCAGQRLSSSNVLSCCHACPHASCSCALLLPLLAAPDARMCRGWPRPLPPCRRQRQLVLAGLHAAARASTSFWASCGRCEPRAAPLAAATSSACPSPARQAAGCARRIAPAPHMPLHWLPGPPAGRHRRPAGRCAHHAPRPPIAPGVATRRSGKRAARGQGPQKARAAPTPSLLRPSMGARCRCRAPLRALTQSAAPSPRARHIGIAAPGAGGVRVPRLGARVARKGSRRPWAPSGSSKRTVRKSQARCCAS